VRRLGRHGETSADAAVAIVARLEAATLAHFTHFARFARLVAAYQARRAGAHFHAALAPAKTHATTFQGALLARRIAQRITHGAAPGDFFRRRFGGFVRGRQNRRRRD